MSSKNKPSFTLIETLLAVALIGGVVVVLWAIFVNCSYLISHSREKTIAINHARLVFEEIENASNTSVLNAKTIPGASGWNAWALSQFHPDNILKNEQVSVQFNTVSIRDLEDVSVSVSWDNRRGNTVAVSLNGRITNK